MNYNEFEINKFSGVINSVVNPDPSTAKRVINFDVWRKEGALQVRNGIQLFKDLNLNTYPHQPHQVNIIGATTYYSQEYNQEFHIILANSTYDYSVFNSSYLEQLNRLSIFTYPSINKINNEYVVVDEIQEINPFFMGCVREIQRKVGAFDFRRLVKIDISNGGEYITEKSLYYWTALVLDNEFNIKNTFLISSNHFSINNTLFLYLYDDYNIRLNDFIFFYKNYVGYETNIGNIKGKFGFIPHLENVRFHKVGNGINIISSNFPVVKLNFDFEKLSYPLYSITNSPNFIYNSNFDTDLGWDTFHNTEIITFQNRKVAHISANQNSYILSKDIDIRSFSGIYELFVEFMNVGENFHNGLLFEIYYEENLPQPEEPERPEESQPYEDNYDLRFIIPPEGEEREFIGENTLVDFFINPNQSNDVKHNLKVMNRWVRFSFPLIIYNNMVIKLKITNTGSGGGQSGNNSFYISQLKLLKVSNQGQDFYSDINHSQYIKFNEPYRNNGFYLSKISEELLTYEEETKVYKPMPILFNDLGRTLPSNSKQMAYRIIGILNHTDEQCLIQNRSMETGETSNNVGKDFQVNYAILNKRLKDFDVYFSETNTNTWLDYNRLAFYKINTDKLVLNITPDGFIKYMTDFKPAEKIYDLITHLGYEPLEGLINTWSDQENNYIAGVKHKGRYYPNTLFYSAISGNGVVMYDTIPLGNVIQIPEEGGSIKRIKLNKYRYLAIIKDNAVYMFDIDSGSYMKISDSDGIIAGNSLVGDGVNLFWLDKNGVKYSDSSKVINLSKNFNQDDIVNEEYKNLSIGYLNSDYKAYELLINNKIYSYPYEGITQNTNKILHYDIYYTYTDIKGNPFYIIKYGDEFKLLRQTLIEQNLYSDYLGLPVAIYETNDFDIVSLGQQLPNDARIIVNEIFIDYESRHAFTYDLIGDNILISAFNIPASQNRKLIRFQIAGGSSKNLFRSVRLLISRGIYSSEDPEPFSYMRIYSIGFSYLIQRITREYKK